MARLFLFLALVCLAAPSAIAGERITARYEIVWTGLTVFELDLEFERDGDRYRVISDGRTKGVLAWLFSGETHIASEGHIVGGKPAPSLYENGGAWSGEEYSRRLRFDAMGRMADISLNIPEKWKSKYPREAVPEAQQVGPDPIALIAYLFNPEEVAKVYSGAVALRSFDGRQVYDTVLTCDGEAVELDKKSRSTTIYSGPARPCTVDFELVAGRLTLTEEQREELRKERAAARKRLERRQRRNRARVKASQGGEKIQLYVADVLGDGLVVPVRGTQPTPFGEMSIYLTELERKPLPSLMVAEYAPAVQLQGAGAVELAVCDIDQSVQKEIVMAEAAVASPARETC